MFKIMITISRYRAAAITLSKSSRAAKSDVEMRRAVANMTAITSVINIDDKNNKWTSKTAEQKSPKIFGFQFHEAAKSTVIPIFSEY